MGKGRGMAGVAAEEGRACHGSNCREDDDEMVVVACRLCDTTFHLDCLGDRERVLCVDCNSILQASSPSSFFPCCSCSSS